MSKPTTDPFWTGDPYDYDGYVQYQTRLFGKGIAMGFGNVLNTCSAVGTPPTSANYVGLDPKTDPFWTGDPHAPLSAYVPSVSPVFGTGVMFGYQVSCSAVDV